MVDHTGSDWQCFPSVERIAWKCGLSIRRTKEILRELRDLKVIDGDTTGGRGNFTTYRIRLENASKSAPFSLKRVRNAARKGCEKQHERVRPSVRKGAKSCTNSQRILIESSEPSGTIIESSGAPAKEQPSHLAFAGLQLFVTQRQDAVLAEAFPWVDRSAEYRTADSWLEANLERRPKKFGRFVHNWFTKFRRRIKTEADMGTSSALTHRQAQQQSAFVRVLTEWLSKLARIHSLNRREPIVLDEADFALYGEALADLSSDVLEAAFRRVVVVCKMFPTPADIRSLVERAETKVSELGAESEWEKLLAWIRENYYPDTGIRRGAPRLDPAVEHAARAAGGFHLIERCGEDKLVWCRKEFLAALSRVRETGQSQHLLGDGDAKRIVAKLHAGPPRPALVAKLPTKAVELHSGSR